jgi:GDP/UDP-N,N'-diacetylbacillosamine 2-epimerase (hydrolysing)
VIFHPVVQDAEFAGYYMANVLKGLPENEQIVILMPNSDAGNTKIREEISSYSSLRSNVNVFTHLSRETYLALLAYSDLLIGNSSSGIIEAASFSTRVINIGQRQNKRERNSNTIDVNVDPLEIKNAISESLTQPSFRPKNLYGDGKSGERIVNILSALEIDENTTKKCNTY